MFSKLVPEDGRLLDPKSGGSFADHQEYITHVLGFCGCGDPLALLVWVKSMFLKHVHQTGDPSYSCWEHNSYENMELMFFLNWADSREFIEHGTTIRCSWMTEAGTALIAAITEIESEEAANTEESSET